MDTTTEATTAFERWAGEVEPRLRRAFAGCRPPDDVPDAVGAALAWAWEHWDRCQQMANPAGYVFRVGQTATRARRGRAVHWLPAPADVGVPDVEPALVPALAALPERQRLAVWLVHGCDWTYAEVAEALGISRSAVGTHVERALVRLRHALEVDPDDR